MGGRRTRGDRPGPIPAESILAEAGLFMKSATVDDGFDTHLQFFFIPRGPMLAAALGRPWGMFLSAQACRPRSRGRVRLRSADAADVPLIDPAFLSDPHDMQLQIEGLREARRIAASEPLKALWRAELSPGLAAQSDADLDVAIRMNAGTVWHPVGTCRMGPGADAVVDAQLRVHGLRGLRVVDASVMPQITSGNTNAPTIMIAEKAAEMIVAG